MRPRACRRAALLLLLHASTTVADRASFDCPMRQMAVEFAAKVQPFRPALEFQRLIDALLADPAAQPGCNISLPTQELQLSSSPLLSHPLPGPAAGLAFYVATDGSDANPGTQASPFGTLAHGVTVARSVGGGANTVVLRGGTYFQPATLSLTAADSGLTVQAFSGEEVWLSGGLPLPALNWTAYNVAPAGSGPSWVIQQGENAVYGQVPFPTVWLIGSFANYSLCSAACNATRNCTVWTWHDDQQGPYSLQCYGRTDGVYAPTAQSGHISGFSVPPANVWVADVSGVGGLSSAGGVVGLRDATASGGGRRLIRARYPNSDPEVQGFNSGLQATSWNAPTTPLQPDQQFSPPTPFRNTSDSFQAYQLGIGGPAAVYSPPASYWASNDTQGGGAFTYRVPSGVVFDKRALPHLPYANATAAVLGALHPGLWASWLFELGPATTYNATSGVFNVTRFARGGFQDARGADTGGAVYIENVLEELDSPSEWYYDAPAEKLYLFWNASSGTPPPSAAGALVATTPSVKTLLSALGTQAVPAVNISLLGLGFRDTAYTYLDPHGVPSGGDWALQRSAALHLEGVRNVTVDGCVFERVDGNALAVTGFARDVNLSRNTFSFIGDTAIVLWGDTTGSPVPGMGPDGTGGDQPRGVAVHENLCHDVGVWSKQSACLFQAKSCNNDVRGNVFWNSPRSLINFNDGFGGGADVAYNLLTNSVKETSDHGPFNSWDRQPYLTDCGGLPSVQKQVDAIHNNLLIANFNGQESLDNDDGSCAFESYSNALVYSGNGLKSDYAGHDNVAHENVYAWVGQGFSLCPQYEGHQDSFFSNRLVMSSEDYGDGQSCSPPGMTILHDNEIYSPLGQVSECGLPLALYQQTTGRDEGTTAAPLSAIDDAKLLGWMREVLGL